MRAVTVLFFMLWPMVLAAAEAPPAVWEKSLTEEGEVWKHGPCKVWDYKNGDGIMIDVRSGSASELVRIGKNGEVPLWRQPYRINPDGEFSVYADAAGYAGRVEAYCSDAFPGLPAGVQRKFRGFAGIGKEQDDSRRESLRQEFADPKTDPVDRLIAASKLVRLGDPDPQYLAYLRREAEKTVERDKKRQK